MFRGLLLASWYIDGAEFNYDGFRGNCLLTYLDWGLGGVAVIVDYRDLGEE